MKNIIYFLDVSKLDVERATKSVSNERREKAKKIKPLCEKRLSLGAGLLLCYALKQNKICNTEILINDSGKPYLASNEAFFSLSHSGDYVICAVSDKEVGCDIEKIRDVSLSVAERFFEKDEKDAVFSRKTKEEQTEAFFELWCEKESILKATGRGISEIGNTKKNELHIFKTDIIKGYKCAACIKDEAAEFELKITDLSDVL